jgi:hypothetical protein
MGAIPIAHVSLNEDLIAWTGLDPRDNKKPQDATTGNTSAEWLKFLNTSVHWSKGAASLDNWFTAQQDLQKSNFSEVEISPPTGSIPNPESPNASASSQEKRILVYRGQPDIRVDNDGKRLILIAEDVFAHAIAEAKLILELTLANGQELPEWIKFNGQTGQLLIDPPPGTQSELVLKLTATDQDGEQASTEFTLRVASPEASPTGRASLSEKLSRADSLGRSDLSAAFETLTARG